MLIELREVGLQAIPQVKLDVIYRGHTVGYFYADIIVNNQLILELKAAEALSQSHEVQLVNYLVATSKEVGLLINFGSTGVNVRREVRDLKSLPAR
ncbi:hypothetical protein HG15A2_42170 [Adhaeretor mobilis]|uniref:GxxExxY protein n=1 Tax=Adhaeretor mobilis TaxID=1930276 RepID=A0A517N163_9BACT|nr:GxxExxY protein [Adhaeretor mobilis]QDT00875.1 hypothetical protein HG15A2_42170 [Adhaeretor mobilis]